MDTCLSPMLHNRLRQWRSKNGLTLEEVSDLTGVSVSHLSRAERGIKRFAPMTKVTIARRLGVPIGELFDVEEVAEVDA